MNFFKKRLYMDFASATPLHKEVARAMHRAEALYGNPSAPHEEGRRAKELLESARGTVARALSVRPETLTFTGSGTESNNLAVVGFIEALIARGASYHELHVITSAFEHPSVAGVLKALEKKGLMVTYVFPNEEGVVSPEKILKALRPETVLVSVVFVQSELGVIQPLTALSHELKKVQKKRELKNQHYVSECALPVLHTDASQGTLFLDVRPERLGADMVTYDAQKIQGPKGVGVLYKHSRVPLEAYVRGGSQERKLRAGTESVVGAVGTARAFALATKNRKERAEKVSRVRDYFIEYLMKEMPDVSVNGSRNHRVPNNVHVSVPDADGDYLAVLMDREGVAVSPRSACIASGSVSEAVLALGRGKAEALGTIRFTFSPSVTKGDARRAVKALRRSRRIATRTT